MLLGILIKKGYKVIENERRKIERFDLELIAYLSVLDKNKKQKSFEFMTSNICAGGVFFNTDIPLAAGTGVKLVIFLPLDKFNNSKGKVSHVEVKGFVIRTDQGGMAICFDKGYKIAPNLYE